MSGGPIWGAIWRFFLLASVSLAGAADIYRWTDDAGQMHFGDRPPPGAERLELRNALPASHYHAIKWIPDGDTLHLAEGRKVRLVGLNAPEVAHRDDPAEPGGPEAQLFLRRLLAGKSVRLEVAPEATDKYERLLAHVFTRDGTNINRRLLRTGHAFATIHPPNTGRAERYFAAERKARKRGRGIWRRAYYAPHSAAEAEGLRNTFRRIRGRIEAVQVKRKYVYLCFANNFQAFLPKARRPLFEQAGKDPSSLAGRTVIVRGWIHRHEGTPRIRLRHPLQIESPV